jgi:menaquinone-dependent protoporphyrinogen IX oxidase
MNGIIIYQGKYGATEQYAQWLAGSLKLPLLKAELATPNVLANYDLIILGSSVYVGKFVINPWLQRNLTSLTGKKIFFFIVCGTTADNQTQQHALIKNNVDPLISNNCDVFFLPGRVIVSKLSWKDWFILKMGAMAEKDPKKKAVMNKGFDGMNQKHLNGLIVGVNSILKQEPFLSAV